MKDYTLDNSDPQTLDLLCMWVAFLEPKVMVEAGTYRGHTALAIGEIIRKLKIPGVLYTADPVDEGVAELALGAGLQNHIRYFWGSYDEMLKQIKEPIDMAYIDASAKDDPTMRLRHVEQTLPRMRKGGLLFVDDAAGHTNGMGKIRKQADLYLPMRRGLAIYQAP